jgi:long-chain acyl-CoA synthetase
MPAIYRDGVTLTYSDLITRTEHWIGQLGLAGVEPGSVCAVIGEFSPESCALMYALMQSKAILVPLSRAVDAEARGLLEIAGADFVLTVDEQDEVSVTRRPQAQANTNALLTGFRKRGAPGLIVFTSGSTGAPKGILHDCERVMRKFLSIRPCWRTVLFLMFDHFGGVNTLLSTFAYGGLGVCVANRSTAAVSRAIQEARATLLPTTPTFLNLLIASGDFRRFDLSSVELITYGTEVMPETTLQRVKEIFPNAQIKQTYGLSELGVLRSKSEDDASLWVKLGGDGFEVKVRDNMLWIRSEANMVGYLNAPDPFDAEGWLCTDDLVEVRGEYVRILGRTSDIINIGGQKVFPSEVEAVLQQADNVRDVIVYGARHPLMGQVVHARVVLNTPEDPTALTERLRRFCVARLARHKVPLRFAVVDDTALYGERYKKVRRADNDATPRGAAD